MNPLITWVAVSAEAMVLALSHLLTGLNYYRAGQHQEASHQFQIVLDRYADSPVADDAMYWNACALEGAGHHDQAAALRTRLVGMFPHSPYCRDIIITPVPAAPSSQPPPDSDSPAPALPTALPSPSPPAAEATGSPIRLVVRNVRGQTVLQFDDRDHPNIAALRAAIMERRQRQPDLQLSFAREADVDLQTVIDAINLLDELGLKYRIEP